MSLAGRIRALEKKLRASGPCPHCKGAGRWAWIIAGAGDDPGEPPGCPHCGARTGVKRLIIEGLHNSALPV